ncbi:TetR/AcrR family transcriptional regulator [Spirillospora sp. NPDC029432]|uniref:TetR/AcrR family transcriptional regulator n=1 Tax=Spirillospora sp. NPDC029432 TaxID=3154599 RepID=UPI003455EC21
MARDRRGQILDVAAGLFVVTGFKGTSLQDIANGVGCSKASLLYHFSGKDAILTELLGPVTAELAELDARLAGLDGEEAVRIAVEGYVDLVLRFRREVKILLDDLEQMFRHPALGDVHQMVDRLVDALAGGRSADPAARIAAAMVLGGVAVAGARAGETADLTDEELRAALVRGALRTLDH